jgi:hypothetical protein
MGLRVTVVTLSVKDVYMGASTAPGSSTVTSETTRMKRREKLWGHDAVKI